MQFRHVLLPALLIGLAVAAAPARAAGTVQLDLVGDAQGAAMAFQEWAEVLGKAGIRNVRLRTARDPDKVGIETQGADQSPIYIVTGIVASRDELILPSGRFRRSDVARLAHWLDDLAEHGPATGKQQQAPFGLSVSQFDKVREDLATAVGFTTQGMTCQQVVGRIAGRLKLPLKLDVETAQALADNKLDEDLSGLACGTALAYVLRSAGYGLLPQTSNGLAYAVVKARADLEVWPVGWPLKKSPQQAMPILFEFLNVNVQNVSAAAALTSIAGRLKAIVLFDHSALARHNIDPAKAMVSLPQSRTTYSLALRKLLFKAGMKFEVRCDEAGTAVLWITSVKPG